LLIFVKVAFFFGFGEDFGNFGGFFLLDFFCTFGSPETGINGAVKG